MIGDKASYFLTTFSFSFKGLLLLHCCFSSFGVFSSDSFFLKRVAASYIPHQQRWLGITTEKDPLGDQVFGRADLADSGGPIG